jgi:hypothetical protein
MPETIELLGSGPPWRRRRRSVDGPRQAPDTLPAERREVLVRWLRRGGNSRWQTLAGDAGHAAYPLAQALLEWLVQAGWAVVSEERRGQGWWPQRVEIVDPGALRVALGLPDPQAARQAWERAGHTHFVHPELLAAAGTLAALPPARALRRLSLLEHLARWHAEERSGTRRDFAWFARGDTKSLSEAEWNWLAEHCDLAGFGISGHTPQLQLAAPLLLHVQRAGRSEGRIALDAADDWIGLTPATVAAMVRADGCPRCWRLIENRSSFERVARQRAFGDGVVWLPGFPPGWWRTAMARLLACAPAAADIACDPDPAGIAIALEAGRIWQAAGLEWQAPEMAAERLRNLPQRKPLTEGDRQQLARLRAAGLPPTLAGLAAALDELGEKGEQEGYL